MALANEMRQGIRNSSATLYLNDIAAAGFDANLQVKTYKNSRVNAYDGFARFNIKPKIDGVPPTAFNTQNYYVATEPYLNLMNRLTNLHIFRQAFPKTSIETKFDPLVLAITLPLYDSEFLKDIEAMILGVAASIFVPLLIAMTSFYALSNAIGDRANKIIASLKVLKLDIVDYWVVQLLVSEAVGLSLFVGQCYFGYLMGINSPFYAEYSYLLLASMAALWIYLQVLTLALLCEVTGDIRGIALMQLSFTVVFVMFFSFVQSTVFPKENSSPNSMLILPQAAFSRFFYELVAQCQGLNKCYNSVSDLDWNIGKFYVSVLSWCVVLTVTFLLIAHKRLKATRAPKANPSGLFCPLIGSDSRKATDEDYCLEVANLDFEYKTGHRVLSNLNLRLKANQIFGLLGSNGAGKTTLFNILIGALKPSKGTVSVFGVPVDQSSVRIGYCAQFDCLWDNFTAREHLRFYFMLKSGHSAYREQRVDDSLRQLNLLEHADKPARALSGGMKRRLSIANAMVYDADILYLDEPSAGLDIENRRLLWETIKAIARCRLVVLSTHLMEEAEHLCDTLGVIADGQIERICSPIDLKSRVIRSVQIQLTLSSDAERAAEVREQLKKHFVGCSVDSDQFGALSVRLSSEENRWSEIMERLCDWTEQKLVKSYSLRNIGLEEAVFKEIRAGNRNPNELNL